MFTDLLADTLKYDDHNRRGLRPVTPERAARRAKLLNEHNILIVGRFTAEHTRIDGTEVGVHVIRIGGGSETTHPLRSEGEFRSVYRMSVLDVDTGEAIQDAEIKRLTEVFSALRGSMAQNPEVVMFHCFAGQQRSATVALAFAKYMNDSEAMDLILENDLYVPLMSIYDKIVKAF